MVGVEVRVHKGDGDRFVALVAEGLQLRADFFRIDALKDSNDLAALGADEVRVGHLGLLVHWKGVEVIIFDRDALVNLDDALVECLCLFDSESEDLGTRLVADDADIFEAW